MGLQLVFALIVSVKGVVDPNNTSYWESVQRCRYFATELTIQGTRRKYVTPVFAYCVPKYVNPEKVTIYR